MKLTGTIVGWLGMAVGYAAYGVALLFLSAWMYKKFLDLGEWLDGRVSLILLSFILVVFLSLLFAIVGGVNTYLRK